MELTTSVDLVRWMLNYSESIGIDTEQILKAADLDYSIFDKPQRRISVIKFSQIWLAMEQSCPDQDLGLRLGEKVLNFPHHVFFLLMLNSRTIKVAMDKFCQYYDLLTYIHRPLLTITKHSVEMVLYYNITGFDTYRHANEAMLTAYASILYRLSDYKIQFETVHFTHAQPDDVCEHERIFKAPLFFGQMENKLIFKKEFLDQPISLSDKNVLSVLEKKAKDIQDRLQIEGSWSGKVSRIIVLMLGKEKVEIEIVAEKLATSARNLQNKLNKEGTTFQELLVYIRKGMAKYLLENETIPLNEIAYNLGYTEHSAFTRAFKKWVGLTPKQYRSKFF